MSSRSLTSTSYAILCLISVRSWSTYELAQLMKRSLHFVWPRAESNLYAEPKRLVDAGMATAEITWNGDRKRTVYSITPEGTAALQTWLGAEPSPQRLESEAAVRILFGNLGSKDDLLRAIARVAADAEDLITEFSGVGEEYAGGNGRFPERIHVNALLLTLMVEQAQVAARWARWARDEVDGWSDTATPDVAWAVREIRRVLDGEPLSDAP